MIKFKVRGWDKVEAFLKSLPRGTLGEAAQAMADYLIGDDRHGLKHYPAYKYVSRRTAYGKPFFTERQRRWFFWALGSGNLKLPYTRTMTLKNGWQKTGNKWNPVIRNTVPYAHHVMSDDKQSRMSKKIGWRTISNNISDNIKGAMQKANQAVQAWINKKSA